MARNAYLAFLGAALLSVAGVVLVAFQPQSTLPSRPNIIIIMADDMGYSDIGSYGGEIRTPHLDALARNGLRFRQFYNAARCCPTRAALLTGKYPHQAGMGHMVVTGTATSVPGPYQGYLNESTTLAEALRENGYSTYMAGKWHVGEKPEHWPRRRGFDRYFGLINGASSYFEIVPQERGIRQFVSDDSLWTPPPTGFYLTDAITSSAQSYLQEHFKYQKQKPFFLYLAYTAPHWPLHALPNDIARYEGRYTKGWDVLHQQRFARMKRLGLINDNYQLSEREKDVPAWEAVPDKEQWARKMSVYAAMVDRMDQGIGQLVGQLKASGQLDNTLIFFLSDNGGCHENIDNKKFSDPNIPIGERGSFVAYDKGWAHASNTPFRKYKSWAQEGGIATPLIVHWPAVIKQKGQITNQVGHVIDLMVTCLDAAKVPATDEERPGQSLLPVLKNKDQTTPRTLFWEHEGNRAVRQGTWKLVWGKPENQWELYNLATDPSEARNLASQQPARVAQLRQQYEQWAAQVGVRQGTQP
jgi:arylsulfatase A-like enzyme